jgi:hypothetical protein
MPWACQSLLTILLEGQLHMVELSSSEQNGKIPARNVLIGPASHANLVSVDAEK